MAGPDALNGGAGKDRFDGGEGADAIEARDAKRDSVNCGAGKDTARLDKADTKPKSCEKRQIGADPAAPDPEPAPETNSGSGVKGNPIGVKTVKSKGKFVGIPGFPGERSRRIISRRTTSSTSSPPRACSSRSRAVRARAGGRATSC